MKLPNKFTFTCTAFEDDEVYRVLMGDSFSTVSWGSGIHEGSTTYSTKSVERFVEEGTWVIQEEEMKLPERFKFKHIDHDTVYEGEFSIGCNTFTVSWFDSEDGEYMFNNMFTPDEASSNVKKGLWIILPETFDKVDNFNFIEESMLAGVDMSAADEDYSPDMFDQTAENPEGMWEDVRAFCVETNAVVTIFPEYFQIAIRGAVTRISTVEGLKELIAAVRVLNKYKLA